MPGYPLGAGPQLTPAGLLDVHGFSRGYSLMCLKYFCTLCWRHVTLTCWLPSKHWSVWHNREALFHIKASSHSIQVHRVMSTQTQGIKTYLFIVSHLVMHDSGLLEVTVYVQPSNPPATLFWCSDQIISLN